jgi:hypothetical protein
MSVEIKKVTNRKELRRFIYLPEKIHQNHPGWVPPIYFDEWRYFNHNTNKAFSFSDTVLALAHANGKTVGRIMGIINNRFNEYKKEKNARFGYLECYDDQKIAHELLSYVENWARARGMIKIVGPLGFNNQDPEGFLIQGFEFKPTISTYFNYAYLNRLLVNEKYSKEVDYVVYKVDIPKEMPEFYSKIYERVINRKEYKVIEFIKRTQLKPYLIPMLELMNDCFTDLYGFQPLNRLEMNDLIKRYLLILDPRFIKIVTKDNQIVGFNIAMPNLSDGIRRAKGRLFPFGLFFILRSAKKTKQLDTLMGGIKKENRGRGVDVLIGYKTIESAQKAGFKFADSHHELEDNMKVRAEMERLGGEIYKRFRIYYKDL